MGGISEAQLFRHWIPARGAIQWRDNDVFTDCELLAISPGAGEDPFSGWALVVLDAAGGAPRFMRTVPLQLCRIPAFTEIPETVATVELVAQPEGR